MNSLVYLKGFLSVRNNDIHQKILEIMVLKKGIDF